jgi:hypothetical protein
MFTRPLRGKVDAQTIEEVCSLRGYLIIAPLASAYLCLSQVSFTEWDKEGRLAWARRALQFLQTDLGYAKAGAYAEAHKFGKMPLQFWGLIDDEI